MVDVLSTIIESLISNYYLFAETHGAVYRIGLNMRSTDLWSQTTCNSSANPGCVDATRELVSAPGEFTAKFTASFTPSADYTLNRLSLAVVIPGGVDGQPWKYQCELADFTGLTINLTGGVQYTTTITQKITYPKTITTTT